MYSTAVAGNVSHQWELHGPVSALSAKSVLISVALSGDWGSLSWVVPKSRTNPQYSLEVLGFLLPSQSTCGHLMLHM